MLTNLPGKASAARRNSRNTLSAKGLQTWPAGIFSACAVVKRASDVSAALGGASDGGLLAASLPGECRQATARTAAGTGGDPPPVPISLDKPFAEDIFLAQQSSPTAAA